MSSTRDRSRFSASVLLLTAAASALCGCVMTQPPQYKAEALQTDPVIVDPAMERRGWDKSVAYYQNGSTVAGTTRWVFAPEPGSSKPRRLWLEPSLFFVNAAVLPFTYVFAPPGTQREYRGSVTEPSYTLNPALPPEGTDAAPATGYVPAGGGDTNGSDTGATGTAADGGAGATGDTDAASDTAGDAGAVPDTGISEVVPQDRTSSPQQPVPPTDTPLPQPSGEPTNLPTGNNANVVSPSPADRQTEPTDMSDEDQ